MFFPGRKLSRPQRHQRLVIQLLGFAFEASVPLGSLYSLLDMLHWAVCAAAQQSRTTHVSWGRTSRGPVAAKVFLRLSCEEEQP